jgi:hypothetical protein
MRLNKTFVDAVKKPIRKVWNEIGGDELELRPLMDNEDAIVACVDEECLVRIAKAPGTKARLRAAYVEHGIGNVVRFLAKRIPLINLKRRTR